MNGKKGNNRLDFLYMILIYFDIRVISKNENELPKLRKRNIKVYAYAYRRNIGPTLLTI